MCFAYGPLARSLYAFTPLAFSSLVQMSLTLSFELNRGAFLNIQYREGSRLDLPTGLSHQRGMSRTVPFRNIKEKHAAPPPALSLIRVQRPYLIFLFLDPPVEQDARRMLH